MVTSKGGGKMAFQVCKNCVFYQPLGWYTRDVKVVGTRRSDNFAELLGALNSYDRRSGRMSGGVGGGVIRESRL